MNTNNIKKYAPQARREFNEAVGKRLNQFGVYADSKGKTLTISEPSFSGSVMQIDGNSFDAGLAQARKRLTSRAEKLGFDPLVEQVAYTWFNRLCAIRFMELKGDYLEHGLRVLSHPEKTNGFELLDHAQDVAEDLGLDRNHIVELKLAGNKDEELYRHLLLGQCHKLHEAMPFLFEALDDETELLLPDNLTRTDSILRGLVDSIPEQDWQQVEIIGWLYQFYISEKKDQVIGSVVKSEDIPAATQLFTPNWIVKYLVQNSVGRQWLMTYPDSGLKALMEYYIEPAEQEASVTANLSAITPASIEPESIKVIDPACGSGHILVEAYEILKAIYEERGYRSRDIPKLILENNLFGLDIDDRAAQLAGFALMMKAREDDRRIFSRDIKLNVLALQSTQDLNLLELWRKLGVNNDSRRGMTESIFDDGQIDLVDELDNASFTALQNVLLLFEQAKTFGSLIQVPADKTEFLHDLKNQLQTLIEQGDSFQKPAAKDLLPFVHQAWLLAKQYDVVVANPPYMGGRLQNKIIKDFSKQTYRDYKADLFAMFAKRSTLFGNSNSFIGFLMPSAWMFLSSYEKLRYQLITENTLETLIQLEYNAFESAAISVCMYTMRNRYISGFVSSNIKLSDFRGSENQPIRTLEAIEKKVDCDWFYLSKNDDYLKIPSYPIAYWASNIIKELFKISQPLAKIALPKQGMATSDNNTFIRAWYEVDIKKVGFRSKSHSDAKDSKKKWFPYNKGGGFRKWYGYNLFVINWENDGAELKKFQSTLNQGWTVRLKSREFYFKEGLTWSFFNVYFGVRVFDNGFLFDVGGSCAFPSNENLVTVAAFLNSNLAYFLMDMLNPTLNFQVENVASLPYLGEAIDKIRVRLIENSEKLISISRMDWNFFETSWEFENFPLINRDLSKGSIKQSWDNFKVYVQLKIEEAISLEIENNRLILEAYGLQNEMQPIVNIEKITLKINPFYRYNIKSDNFDDNSASTADIDNLFSRFFQDTIKELLSYSIGCMMGRYSLDHEGLVYSYSSNEGFDELVAGDTYKTFPSDDDGILPLTDQEWFKDDVTNRFRDFVRSVWGEENLQLNLDFVAESLCLSTLKSKKSENSLETVRRYLSTQFYKDHLKTYKKRPIYWLFSSGKQKAFECLVYLHRYNESTLSRMRTEYVTPLLGKYNSFADQLNKQIEDATTSEGTQLKKELVALEKKQTELREFDDHLKHYADMRIKLDLDDGVKVNYGKFGDLLAEVKVVTGGKGD